MYIPSPEPPRGPCFQNFVNTRLRMSGLMPVALVVDVQQHPGVRRLVADRGAVSVTCPSPCRIAFSTRLVDHLRELVGVGPDLRAARPSTSKRDLAAGAGADRRDDAVDGGAEVDRPRVERQPAGVDAGHVEQLGDQPGQPVGVGVDRLEHHLLLVVVEPVPLGQQRRGEALDAGQRRAQLVGDGGDQVGALAVEPLAGPGGAQRRRDPLRPARCGRPRGDAGGDEQLGAVGEHQPARPARCGSPARRTGSAQANQLLPVEVLQAHHVGEVLADPVADARASGRRRALTCVTRPVGVGDHDAVRAARRAVLGPDVHGRPPLSRIPGQAAARVSSAVRSRVRVRARGGVEAHRRGRREVEALGAAVDRDAHPVVGQRRDLVGQPPRLVAEQPGGRAGQQAGVERRRGRRSPAPSAASTGTPASRSAGRPRPGRRSTTSGRWNRLPADGAHGLAVVRVDADVPASTTASAPAASAQRITVPALPGSRTSAQTATSRGRPPSSTSARGSSRKRQTATMPCGVTVSAQRGERASSTSCHGHGPPPRRGRGGAASRPWRRVAKTSRTQPGTASASASGLRALGEEQPCSARTHDWRASGPS